MFDLINQHDLFDKVGDKVYELMKFDPERASELLINNVNRIPVARVIKQLQPEEKLQLMYLDKLFFHSNKEHNQVGPPSIKLSPNFRKEKNSTICK